MSGDFVSRIVGTWQVERYVLTVVDTGEESQPFGEDARGYIQYMPSGHMSVVVSGFAPRPLTSAYTSDERAHFNTKIIAYCGTYHVEGERLVHRVEAGWLPHWIGSDQVRYPDFDGDTVTIRSAPMMSPLLGKEVVATLSFRRVE